MKPYRSLLFVPGHKSSWADKAIRSGTDAVILDLEDSVPRQHKGSARERVRATVERLGGQGVDIWVRPNGHHSGLQAPDLSSVVVSQLTGLFLPKVVSAREIVGIDAVLSYLEQRRGIPDGSVQLIVTFETPESMSQCEEIALAAPRIASLAGVTGPDGDVARALGFEFSEQGLESLYLRSRIVLTARCNNLHHPLAGVWQDVVDLDGFRRFSEDNRRLGYRGMVVIHPAHVAVANEIFTPSDEVVAHSRRLVAAHAEAVRRGDGAVLFEGRHIDAAHVATAEGLIELADSLSGRKGPRSTPDHESNGGDSVGRGVNVLGES